MNHKNIYTQIEKAIREKKVLTLSIKPGIGNDNIDNIKFDPYILGDDTFQHPFVFGFISWSGLFYKFRLYDIKQCKLSQVNFEVSERATYHHAIEEDHYAIAEGLKIYG